MTQARYPQPQPDDPEPRRLTILADEIRAEVDAAAADLQSAVGHAIHAGEKLIEAKGLVTHGQWLPWLEANFDGSERTARDYMRLAANRQHVADSPSIRQAVALLAEPRPTLEQGAAAALVEFQRAEPLPEGEAVGDRLAAAKRYLAAADAAWEVVRATAREFLALSLRERDRGPFVSACARAGAAGLAHADHFEPWDDRHDECEDEWRRALGAVDAEVERLEGEPA